MPNIRFDLMQSNLANWHLNVFMSKVLKIIWNSSWYVNNENIHNDLFHDKIRHFYQKFYGKLKRRHINETVTQKSTLLTLR